MGFFIKDNIYRITRITGSQDNILGVVFDDKNNSDNNIEVIEWDFPNIDKSRIRTSKKEVLEQVLSGLEWVNQALGTNYKLCNSALGAALSQDQRGQDRRHRETLTGRPVRSNSRAQCQAHPLSAAFQN